MQAAEDILDIFYEFFSRKLFRCQPKWPRQNSVSEKKKNIYENDEFKKDNILANNGSLRKFKEKKYQKSMENKLTTFQLKCIFLDNLTGTEKSRIRQEYKRRWMKREGKNSSCFYA